MKTGADSSAPSLRWQYQIVLFNLFYINTLKADFFILLCHIVIYLMYNNDRNNWLFLVHQQKKYILKNTYLKVIPTFIMWNKMVGKILFCFKIFHIKFYNWNIWQNIRSRWYTYVISQLKHLIYLNWHRLSILFWH